MAQRKPIIDKKTNAWYDKITAIKSEKAETCLVFIALIACYFLRLSI